MSAPFEPGDVEIWRELLVGDRIIEVSSLGRVKTFGRLRALYPAPNGYLTVGISYARGKQKTMAVHPLVMEAFLGPCPVGHERAHLDGNKSNNRSDNLAYVTHRENMAHQWEHGTRATGERAGPDKLNWESVTEIRRLHASGTSKHALARQFNVCRRTIGNVVEHLHWRFKPREVQPA
jgi:hypothetical protein